MKFPKLAKFIFLTIWFVLLFGPGLTGEVLAYNVAGQGYGYFSPSSGNYTTGNQFQIGVHIDTSQSFRIAYVVFSYNGSLDYLGGSVNSSSSITSAGTNEYAINYSAASSVSGNIVVATLTFKATSSGTVNLIMNVAQTRASSASPVTYVQSTQNASYTVVQPASSPTPPSSTSPSSNTPPQKTSHPGTQSSGSKTSTEPSAGSGASSSRAPGSSSYSNSINSTPTQSLTIPSNNELNTPLTNSYSSSPSSSKPSIKSKSAKSSNHVVVLVLFIMLAAAGFLIILYRRRMKAPETYEASEATQVLSTNRQNVQPGAPPYALHSQSQAENDRIERSIERAFYPLRYKAEEEQRRKEHKE